MRRVRTRAAQSRARDARSSKASERCSHRMNQTMSKTRVAILGLGLMGSGMAKRLLSEKFPVVVYNRSRAKSEALAVDGATVAGSPREAAAMVQVVISMVADDAASRAVWLGENGALPGAASGTLLVESSTLTTGWVRELATAAARQNCDFLDAPVTGSKPHAASGELRFLVGGSAEALEAARPVLAALGRDIVHLGPTGSGTTMKLVNNFLCGVQAASFAEAMALVEANGLDSEQAAKILADGAPGSPLIKAIWTRAAIGDLTPNFVLRLMAKDLKYSLEEAKRFGLTLKAAIPAIEVFEDAVKHGYGDQDFAAVIEAQRQR
ncbi:MAG TPA: NAD(P)-dependent oxidoreductase [Candidatus Angelobacter sp.]|nr:NAD(P)-dependent oxidoreductase [Candidatus Angelobacter sp.]